MANYTPDNKPPRDVHLFMDELFVSEVNRALDSDKCFYQRKNNQGQKYCSVVLYDDSNYNKIKSICPCLGEQRNISVVTGVGLNRSGDEETDKLIGNFEKNLLSLESDFGKKLRNKLIGDPDLGFKASEEYACNLCSKTYDLFLEDEE
ncbi:MAG: hypothetical protein ACP5OG_05405 [Candidatus Nanoarchaeia archaeon]